MERQDLMNIKWPIVIAISIALVYTAVLYLIYNSELPSWLHSAVATLFAVMLGIPVAIAIYRLQQTDLARQERERHLQLLSLELTNVQHLLRDDKRVHITTRSGRQFKVQITNLEPIVLETAGKSGLFTEHESFMMLDLTGSMRMWNKKTEALLNALNGMSDDPALDSRIEWIMTNLDKSRSGILTGTTILSQRLDIKLKENIAEYY
ncbi:MAG: hypothetical protein KAT65_27060 [Methanophagales archaeon]|nr:hypothetical protein [Methanophagales archaeon]